MPQEVLNHLSELFLNRLEEQDMKKISLKNVNMKGTVRST